MNKKELTHSLRKQGFSEKIVWAFKNVNREDFIPETFKRYAYLDEALPIGYGSTISQPYTIAFVLKLLELDKEKNEKLKILEIGSGSGYVLALINQICPRAKIIGIERIKELADSSKELLKEKRNINILSGDGSKGLKKEKPFDRIIVSACSENIIDELVDQLSDQGILIIPVKNSIFKIKKNYITIKKEEYPGFVFVPLIKK